MSCKSPCSPSIRRGGDSGGALLGDRIRMNAINHRQHLSCVRWRRAGASAELSDALPDAVAACKAAGFDLIIVETSGIGQGDAAIVPHWPTFPLYVMTPEFGAASQLEKIDMLDFADFVAINKFDRRGAEDALARRAQAISAQPASVRPCRPTKCRCTARSRRASTTMGLQRCTTHSPPGLPDHGFRQPDGPADARGEAGVGRPARSCRSSARAISPKSPTACVRITVAQPSKARRRATARHFAGRPYCAPQRGRNGGDFDELIAAKDALLDRARHKELAGDLAGHGEDAMQRDEFVTKVRGREHARPRSPTPLCPGTKSARSPLPRFARSRRHPALAAARERARRFSLHGRRIRVQARERGPDADVRRRGRCLPHQSSVPPSVAGHAGQTAVHRLRLGHALRLRSRRAARTFTARSAIRACRSPPSTI